MPRETEHSRPDFRLWAGEIPREPGSCLTIYKEGEPGDSMDLVRFGSVEIRCDGRLLEVAAPDSIFGEMAIIEKMPRSAGAVAQTDCKLEVIGEKTLLFRVGRTPFFAPSVMRALAANLRAANTNA